MIPNDPESYVAEYPALYDRIVAAGQSAGLIFNDDPQRNARLAEDPHPHWLTQPVCFSLRPTADYHRNFRGSWTEMIIKPILGEEFGPDGIGVGLVFETSFSLAHQDSDTVFVPSLLITDLLARLEDFAASHPDEAANLLTIPCRFEMYIEGEIIYIPAEDEGPFLDIGLYPALTLAIDIFEAVDFTAFEQSLAGLVGTESAVVDAIEATMHRLALLLRWLDTEAEPHPPLLDSDL